MHTKLTLTFLLTLLAVPCMVLGASPPPAVPEVQATLEGNAIRVSWQVPPQDVSGIAYYRVYYSRQSIVGNGGDYDDFERTKGAETSYVFTEPPVGGTSVTFGVLAVSMDGIESEGFLTEATVVFPTQTPSVTTTTESTASSMASTMAASPTVPTSATPPLTIIAVAPLSMTGILIAFSEPLSDVAIGPEAFLVVDSSGTLLPTVRAEVNGASVLVHTVMQIPGEAYAIAVTRPLRGISGSMIDPSALPPVRFIATPVTPFSSTSPTMPVPTPVEKPEPIPYVRRPLPPVVPSPVERLTPPPHTDRTPLAESGPGLLLVFGAAGAMAGTSVIRRRIARHVA